LIVFAAMLRRFATKRLSLARSHSLIDASWDEGEIIRCELVVACCDSSTLFDLLEEPLDQLRARSADPMALEI